MAASARSRDLDLHLQLEQRERVEGGGQGLGQRLQLGLHVGGQVGQDAARRASGDQPVEYAPPVDAEDVRQDAAEAQAVVVERFVDPVAGPATLGDQRPAVSGQLAQLAELTGRDIARQGEAELTDAGQPQTVVDIGLLAANLFDVLGMKQFGVNAGVFQGLERDFPVDPGAFHRGRGDCRATEASRSSPADRRATR